MPKKKTQVNKIDDKKSNDIKKMEKLFKELFDFVEVIKAEFEMLKWPKD